MSSPTDDRHGADVLLLEIREETGRLIHHPIEEVKRLEHVVEEGDSPATLLLLMLVVAGVALVIGAIVIAVALTVYYTG
jgi:hypothetical protein